MSGGLEALTIVTALVFALVGGVFFAFSNFVMAGLGRRPAPEGAAAMQSINVTVINPLFMSALFAVCLPALALAGVGVANLDEPYGPWLLGGGLGYVVGSPIVTMVLNVPLNNELERSDPQSTEGAEVWQRYLREWTRWNTVRTVASLAASAALMIALIA